MVSPLPACFRKLTPDLTAVTCCLTFGEEVGVEGAQGHVLVHQRVLLSIPVAVPQQTHEVRVLHFAEESHLGLEAEKSESVG